MNMNGLGAIISVLVLMQCLMVWGSPIVSILQEKDTVSRLPAANEPITGRHLRRQSPFFGEGSYVDLEGTPSSE
ncbi:hypothetical protein DFH07DRAFT_794826 [Mycena maculata]|uniref:Uncharacterized protein n=1 Tax=Mycena maculata TaxID=230809 RepID=A0AAD7KB23_9AGAR|nr:hypothetical protein DFH07DRAFT_794826 [Mycena maculata]